LRLAALVGRERDGHDVNQAEDFNTLYAKLISSL